MTLLVFSKSNYCTYYLQLNDVTLHKLYNIYLSSITQCDSPHGYSDIVGTPQDADISVNHSLIDHQQPSASNGNVLQVIIVSILYSSSKYFNVQFLSLGLSLL